MSDRYTDLRVDPKDVGLACALGLAEYKPQLGVYTLTEKGEQWIRQYTSERIREYCDQARQRARIVMGMATRSTVGASDPTLAALADDVFRLADALEAGR